MLVSLKWLRDYVDCSLDPRELAEKLTMAGLEVESVNPGGPDFSGVVVARIESLKPHPNADKLSLCEVGTGDRTYRVVCGASNIKVGDLVPLATVGAAIPGGYTIRHSTIRGEASEGMLCSEEELKIGDDDSGIMILDPSLPLGEDLRKALDLEDTVLDVAVTPNRPDCLSILGIAREVAVITGSRLHYPETVCPERGDPIESQTSVEILSPHLCPRYTARLIKNVRVRPSPLWLRVRLEAVGLRAINNVVDVTNFVMMELGQPLHAFDFAFLEEGRIVVRGAEEGEEFRSLDEKTRLLKKDMLVICDGVKPVAIAGIMGGLNSEVREETDTILLESAYFDPASIRKTARILGMSTDAAFRFERGVDPEGVTRALDRAAMLMAELSDGDVAPGIIDEYPRPLEVPGPIRLRSARAADIIGISLEPFRVKKILLDLEMVVEESKEGEFVVTPPSFRGDLTREIDLIEEIARVNGYNEIPPTLPFLTPPSRRDEKAERVDDLIRDVFLGLGYLEVINYSFTSPDSGHKLGFPEDHESWRFVRIANPLTEDSSVLRTNLVYGLLESMGRNINVGNTDLKFFEMGNIFLHVNEDKLPWERYRIAGLLTGARYDRSWHYKDMLSDFYDIKGCLETLFATLGIERPRFVPTQGVPFLHPGRAAEIFLGDKPAGVMGEVHPDVLAGMDIHQAAFVFELDRDSLLEVALLSRTFHEIPRFPAINRDVAFLVENDVKAGDIIALCRSEEEELLEKVDVFDVYSGPSIPAGMKSLALKFTYRSAAKTLADHEINETHQRVVQRIVEATGAKIRGAI